MTPYLAARGRRPHPSAAFATSARAPSSPRWRRRPAAAAPPRRPERVAPLTDAAIAAAPNRIERKWNRRRRPGGGPSRSRCRPRARESSDKEEERAPIALIFRCRGLAMTPVPRGRRSPAPRRRRGGRMIDRRERPSSIVRPQPDSAKTESAKTKLRRRPAAAPRRPRRQRVALLVTLLPHRCLG